MSSSKIGADMEHAKDDELGQRPPAATRVYLQWLVAVLVLLGIVGHSLNAQGWSMRPAGTDSPVHTTGGCNEPFLLGVGKADVTGPIVEVEMMGYASKDQIGTGLHIRQFARAFIVADGCHVDSRFVYVSADICMGDWAVKNQVLKALSEKYRLLYSASNVAIVGTHTHAGTAGFLNYLLPQIPSLGAHRPTLDAIVDGIVQSIVQAHESLQPGTLSLSKKTVLDANLNRSPSAYLANPKEERDKYSYDQDKEMTMLSFRGRDGQPLGLLNWFPVHGTSMYNNNTLISGDNKGAAAQFLEKRFSAEENAQSFVAGFSQSNVGDTSPNILGAFCEDTGEPCDFFASTCNNRTTLCKGRGPGFRMSDKESTRIIGQRQADAAYELWRSEESIVLAGPVQAAQGFFDLSSYTFAKNGRSISTCPAALGYSFAGGTTDGPGAFDFTQGDNKTSQNPFWEIVKRFIKNPSREQIECHAPKPILLDIGEIHRPYEWAPATVDVQLFRIGPMVILVVPGEFTTMAGRRAREAVQAALEESESRFAENEIFTVLGGPANVYAHYVATREEYSVQRYEGASTVFGPHTLDAYIDILANQLVPVLLGKRGFPSKTTSAPDDLSGVARSLIRGVIRDSTPSDKQFGEVLIDVDAKYCGAANISAVFQAANPRNNLRHGSTFLSIERYDERSSRWRVIADDNDWQTELRWRKTWNLLGYSQSTVSWYPVESETPPGTYRINYFGDHKSFFGIKSFKGTSSEFKYTGMCNV